MSTGFIYFFKFPNLDRFQNYINRKNDILIIGGYSERTGF